MDSSYEEEDWAPGASLPLDNYAKEVVPRIVRDFHRNAYLNVVVVAVVDEHRYFDCQTADDVPEEA